jgi:hypothetical protein
MPSHFRVFLIATTAALVLAPAASADAGATNGAVPSWNDAGGAAPVWDGGNSQAPSSAPAPALIRAGLLAYPMVSGTLAHWGAAGAGSYVTIYANKSHVYMEVAGLRLDTSSVGDPSGQSGVRWRPPIGKRFGFAVRHLVGL